MNHLYLINFSRTLYDVTTLVYTPFSGKKKMVTKTDHMKGHRIIPSQLKD